MPIRSTFRCGALAALVWLAGCGEQATGPIAISAIGGPPMLINPNLRPLDPASAYLALATAQGLVRFDQSGQIEPALAQSWIVSDDGLRYTFRLSRTEWAPGQPITAQQIVARLRAAIGRNSRNDLLPQLGAIDEVEAMTDDVIEISLKGPRPNFLQLLAQPEIAIIRNELGTGPYRSERQPDRSLLLTVPRHTDDDETDAAPAAVVLRGERASLAVARFVTGQADFVIGGGAGDLPIARAADLPANALRFDPVAGLFGFVFVARNGPLAEASVRQALSMAIDRDAIVDDMNVAGLEPRASLVPAGIDELRDPATPDWNASPPAERQQRAAQAVAAATDGKPLTVRVAMPNGPGYRVIFAHLRRDWRTIGVEAERVGADASADLRLVDAVAPIVQAAWYLRHFNCGASAVCVPEADTLLDTARAAPTVAERHQALAGADVLLSAAAPFIPIAAPVRWLLVSPRLTGFQPNQFGQHFPASLLAQPR